MPIPVVGRKRGPSPDAMTLAEHLAELRHRLIVSVVAFVIAGTVAAVFYNWFLGVLQHPYCHVRPHNCRFYVTGPLDPLSLRVEMAAFGGLVLASPVILWQMWRFITPGLRDKERRYVIPFVLASLVLFLAGCATAYFIFPHALQFLIDVGGPRLFEILSPNSYLSLILLMMALFGLSFEFPVVLVALELVRVVTPAQLLHWWRWSVIAITAGAAIFTPSSDPFSMLALAVPLVVFYFAAIGIGKLLGR
ncbi:MAG: twin-arginine translocase subunit TatC [Actinomycetota bacterium]|nr:twin-arginine translocase subunit TatC [Actinomycetota bacterium]